MYTLNDVFDEADEILTDLFLNETIETDDVQVFAAARLIESHVMEMDETFARIIVNAWWKTGTILTWRYRNV